MDRQTCYGAVQPRSSRVLLDQRVAEGLMPADRHNMDRPVIIVITGVMAAGKSTVARRLAGRFARGVHIEADALHRLIVSGRAGVRAPGTPRGEAARQLRLRLRQLCLLGRSFFEAGFTVVLDDLILGERWAQLREELRGLPVALVVLAPRMEVVVQRDADRAQPTQGVAWAQYLDAMLRATMANSGLWIDTSAQTPDETVADILRQLTPQHHARSGHPGAPDQVVIEPPQAG